MTLPEIWLHNADNNTDIKELFAMLDLDGSGFLEWEVLYAYAVWFLRSVLSYPVLTTHAHTHAHTHRSSRSLQSMLRQATR